MGCDIHLVLERRTAEGKWIGMHSFDAIPKDGGYVWWAASDRNYELFAALAGVRGVGPEAKGLPEDISELARFLAGKYGADGHSHSWVYAGEFVKAVCEHGYASDQLRETHLKGLMTPGDRWYTDVADVILGFVDTDTDYDFELASTGVPVTEWYRVVFWFDN